MAPYCDVICVLALLSLFGVVWSSPIHQDRCHHVRQSNLKYLTKSDHHSHIIKDICPHMSSGCCSGLELAIESKTRQHFSDQMTSHLESFRVNYVQRESRIRNKLNSIFNETIERVNQKYSSRIANASEELLKFVNQNVFNASRLHLHSSAIDSHVDNLLKAIIISELERSHVIEYEYANCLLSVNFEEIFVNIRSKIVRDVHSAIETSRLILQSFQLSSELLSRSEKVKLSENCVRRLAADFHCGACLDRDSAVTRLCGSICLSTISTCVSSSQLANFDETWKGLTHSLDQLVDSVMVQRNPETIFAAYPSLIEQALELARSKNEILKKARVSCGPMKGKYPSSHLDNIPNFTTEHHTFSESLFVSIQSMAHLWTHNKDMFANLPQKFCQKHSDKDCLDSRSSVSTQLATALPLVNHSVVHDVDEFFERVKHYQNAIETIKSNRLKLSNRTVYSYEEEDINSPNSLLHDGSGSGSDSVDDEPGDDELEGSGSDVSPIPDTTAKTTTDGFSFTTVSTSSPRELEPVVGTGSSGSTLRSSLVLFISLLVLLCSLSLQRH